MMNGYVLSILGIVLLGIIIDIIIPNGSINKYIKSVYVIFIVAVIISPIVKLMNIEHELNIKYENYEISENLLNYIYSKRVEEIEHSLITKLEEEGFSGINIIINFSSQNNELRYISCIVNLKNMVISSDKQHINSYEFITRLVTTTTGLEDKEIIFDG